MADVRLSTEHLSQALESHFWGGPRRGKVLFIDGTREVARDRCKSFLRPGAPAADPDRLRGVCSRRRRPAPL